MYMHFDLRLFFKGALLLLMTVCFNQGLYRWLNMPYFWGVDYNMQQRLECDASTVDVLCLGTSRTAGQLLVPLFDSLTNKRCFNAAVPGFSMNEINHYLPYFFEESKVRPKYVLIELSYCDIRQPIISKSLRAKYDYGCRDYLDAVKLLATSPYSRDTITTGLLNHTKNIVESILRIGILNSAERFIYSFKKQSKIACDSILPSAIDSIGLKFRHYLMTRDTSSYIKMRNYSRYIYNNSHSLPSLNPFYWNLIISIKRICAQYQAKAIFYLPPRIYPEDYQLLLPAYNALNDDEKLDYSNASLYPKFYDAAYIADLTHLNYKGAVLFTTNIARDIKAKF